MPDEDAIVSEAVVDPVAVADPVVDPAPAPEPEPKPDTPAIAEPPAPVMVPLRVLQERVGEETNKRQAAEEAARQAEERSRSYEEIVKRLQAEPKPGETVKPAAPAAPAADNRNAVEQEAARLIFLRDVQAVQAEGATAYGARWNDAVNALTAYGAAADEFVSQVMEINKDKAHDILFAIAQEPERAIGLTKMSPARRIAEITRISDAMAKPEPKTETKPAESVKPAISKAPTPKPVVAPHAPTIEIDITNPDHHEKMSDRDFERAYKDKYMRRTG